jgi:DNA polymerase-3 subunit alpha
MERNLIPKSLDWEKRLFVFNKALRKNCKQGDYYIIQNNYYDFYEQFFDIDLLEPCGDTVGIPQKTWQKLYTKGMDKARDYFKEHQQELLDKLNGTLFQELWDKYATGSLADWEMDSLAFYYHEHPLKDINKTQYDIKEYRDLPENPEIARTFKKGDSAFHTYKTCRIVGTVIAKDDTKSCISLLTVKSGVVTVKMSRDYYARLNKQISEMQISGKKKVVEKSWFTRGTMLMVNGFKRGGIFFAKSYRNQKSHQVYKIEQINDDKTIKTEWQRYDEK